MQIVRIRGHQVSLPVKGGTYAMSGGQNISTFDSTILVMDTDEGLTGVAETCPLGPLYLPAFPEGVRTGMRVIAPHLLGMDPTNIGAINTKMDRILKGHAYAKSQFDIACWDILGKSCNVPVATLLGGAAGDGVDVYRSVSLGDPQAMVAEIQEFQELGFRTWQLKVGDPDIALDRERIESCLDVAAGQQVVADANTGWLPHQARSVLGNFAGTSLIVEQPCATYEACCSVRASTGLPMVLDEIIEGTDGVARAWRDGMVDGINIKIARVGGLSKARALRDACVSLGIPVTIEDMPGADITGATILHLAHSTPERFRLSVTSSYQKFDGHVADGGPVIENGRASSNQGPGLGVTPIYPVLGAPIYDSRDVS